MLENEKIIEKILKKVKEKVLFQKEINVSTIRDIISEFVIKESESNYITNDDKKMLIDEIYNQLIKYGKIQSYLDDKQISEIMINGKDNIFVEKHGILEHTDTKLSMQELEELIQKMVITMNRTVNQAVPIVDARLEDGSRVNVVLNPIALNGPIVTIRKFSKEVLDISQLIENETLDEEVANFLEKIVKKKYNIFVSGGTGSGKTTLLNILSNFIDEYERVITIEDSAELKIRNIKNLVSLETRNKNSEGFGEITIRDLIRSSLRMRPDRIIVGEVRGKETLDMLQAMNTGHDGSLSTGHANSAKDMLTRLESMILMNYDIPIEAVKRQIASALDVIIHMSKTRKGKRIIEEIVEVVGYENGKYELNVIYKRDKEGKLIKKNELIKEYTYEEILC